MEAELRWDHDDGTEPKKISNGPRIFLIDDMVHQKKGPNYEKATFNLYSHALSELHGLNT
jgi:hypothetical protein